MKKNRVLLVEDDESLGFVVQDVLTRNDLEVFWEKTGSHGLEAFTLNEFDLCLLDVMMPNMDGFSLAQHIRSKDEFVPILFLTARSQQQDRLKGFEIGGDDYITKPFSMDELLYRVKVFLRRKGNADQPITQDKIGIGSYLYDPQNLSLISDDRTCNLTQMESELLTLLVKNRNQLVSREEILIKIWGENDYFKGRSLDVFISRLRKYLNSDQSIKILNHHGVGFKLEVN